MTMYGCEWVVTNVSLKGKWERLEKCSKSNGIAVEKQLIPIAQAFEVLMRSFYNGKTTYIDVFV